MDDLAGQDVNEHGLKGKNDVPPLPVRQSEARPLLVEPPPETQCEFNGPLGIHGQTNTHCVGFLIAHARSHGSGFIDRPARPSAADRRATVPYRWEAPRSIVF